MKVKVYNVVIVRDKMSRVSKPFMWAWELPIWEEKYPDGNVIVNGKETVELDKLPNAANEYGRLLNLGLENETNIPHVFNVYGRKAKGVKALEKAIKASVVKKRAAAKPKPKPAVPAEPDDPLA